MTGRRRRLTIWVPACGGVDGQTSGNPFEVRQAVGPGYKGGRDAEHGSAQEKEGNKLHREGMDDGNLEKVDLK